MIKGRTRSSIVSIGSRRLSSFVTQAAVCTELGKPLVFKDWSIASPRKNELRVEVVAAGINFADSLQVRGLYQEKLTPPFVSGMECVGYVTEIGIDTECDFEVGDPVICISFAGGSFARHIVLPSQSVIRLPRQLTPSINLNEAAALLVNYGTAHMGLTARSRLCRDETVLITAAAGGVGLAAVEIARNMGARIIVAAGTDSKVELALSRAGSNSIGLNYDGCNGKQFRAKLLDSVGKGGIDVMMDAIGGEFLEAGIRSLNWDGRAVVVGFAGGIIPKIPANILLVKNVEVSGLYWGASAIHNPRLFMQSCQEVIKMWLTGSIKPHISHCLSLEKANEALAIIESRKSTGKVILV